MAKRITRKQMEEQVFRMTGRRHKIPHRDSELWPPRCRGDQWDWGRAMFYVGRCQMCEHACRPPEGRRKMDDMAFLPTFLLCTNHPDAPGQLRQMMPSQMCRNFRRRREPRRRAKRVTHAAGEGADLNLGSYESDNSACLIELSGGYFVIVDPEDYAELRKYKWSASNTNGRVVAVRRKNGRTVTMHREIMKPKKGEVVDHIHHNTLDNRRRSLRDCTSAQNHANMGPRGGSSPYVGVWRHGKKWVAGLNWRGKHYYLGIFDDPIEAAKVRDRKAYELLGAYAYLNFPEDFGLAKI